MNYLIIKRSHFLIKILFGNILFHQRRLLNGRLKPIFQSQYLPVRIPLLFVFDWKHIRNRESGSWEGGVKEEGGIPTRSHELSGRLKDFLGHARIGTYAL